MLTNLKSFIFFGILLASIVPSQSFAQDLIWANQYGLKGSTSVSGGTNSARAVAIDEHNNIYTAGKFGDSIDFNPAGPSHIVKAVDDDHDDIYFTKTDPNGNLIWVKRIGNLTGIRTVESIAVHKGILYLLGNHEDQLDLDPDAGTFIHTTHLGVSEGGFVAQYSTLDGSFLRAHYLIDDGPKESIIYQIRFDAADNIFLRGSIGDDTDFDFDTSSTDTSYVRVDPGDIISFICKVDKDFNLLWVQNFGDNLTMTSFDLDSKGDIYFTGRFRKTLDFDPGSGTDSKTGDFSRWQWYLSSWDNDGDYKWVKCSSTPGNSNTPRQIGLDKDDDIYVVGNWRDSVDVKLDGSAADYIGSTNSDFFAKYSNTGAYLNSGSFTKKWLQPTLYIDDYNNFYFQGQFRDSTDMDPTAGVSKVYSSGVANFITKLNEDGDYQWSKLLIVPGDNIYVTEFLVDGSGNIVSVGYHEGGADFDPGMDTTVLPFLNSTLHSFIQKLQQCEPTTSTLTASACISYTSPTGKHVWDSTGIYEDRIPMARGCDSIIIVDLTIQEVDTSVMVVGATLVSNATTGTFQWINCNTMSPIAGATASNFTPPGSGSYAVIVTVAGCSDTSACISVTGIDDDPETEMIAWKVYPNPSSGFLNVESLSEPSEIQIRQLNMNGQIIKAWNFDHLASAELELAGAAGIYFLEIEDKLGNRLVQKIVLDK